MKKGINGIILFIAFATLALSGCGGSSGGGGGSSSSGVAEVKYFAGDSGNTGLELWKTNGTEGGTVLVKDIIEGFESSDPYGFTDVGDKTFFMADILIDYGGGEIYTDNSLFVTDGTAAGTMPVFTNDSSFIQDIYSPTDVSGTLYFWEDNDCYCLYKSDGTREGTVAITDADGFEIEYDDENISVLNGDVFVVAY
ncbi:hypothetical protein KAR91_16395, partial [Candidatus Pacearchaeota archaeon]|nr:hypothetical protein [Candidatus Pacearchaeota archaeon]